MEISLKYQKLPDEPIASETSLTICQELTVEDENLVKKRGRLFLITSIETPDTENRAGAANLFMEDLKENYYRDTEETPMHSIEKSLLRAVKKTGYNTKFVSVLIWNKVLYCSYNCHPALYLIRGSGVRNLALSETVSEIWTSSAILADGDVFVAGTDAFASKYPSEAIAGELGLISKKMNEEKESDTVALLIKVSEGLNRKTIGYGLSTNIAKKFKNAFHSSTDIIKSKLSKPKTLSDKFKMYQNKKSAPISSISGLSNSSDSLIHSGSNAKRIRSNPKMAKKHFLVAATMVVILLSVLGLNYRFDFFAEKKEADKINPSLSGTNVLQASDQNTGGTENTQEPKKIHSVFIQLDKIKNAVVLATLSSTQKELVLLDLNSKSILRVNPQTLESKSFPLELENPEVVRCDISLCVATDNGVFYVFKPEDTSKVDHYSPEEKYIVDVYPFINSVYILSMDSIYSYPLGQDTNKKKWLNEGVKLNDPKSFATDGSMYVLEGKTVNKYRGGSKDIAFKISGYELVNPRQIEVNESGLYVLDSSASKKAVALFNKQNGAFIREIKLASNDDPEIIENFTITKFGLSQIIFEKGKVLYKVGL